MDHVPRFLADALRRAATTFPVVMVTGARQTGKTTLLRHEFGESHLYVSLDRPDVRLRAQSDPVSFLGEHPPPLILDEVQHLPELLPYIKSLVDEDRRPGSWVLAGSKGFGLMKGVSESLAGRVAVLTLDPLAVGEGRAPFPIPSMDELLETVFGGVGGASATGASATGASATGASATGAPGAGPPGTGTPGTGISGTGVPGTGAQIPEFKDPDLADWILRGGYPEPRLQPKVDRQLWLSGYTQTYLERDVRDLTQVGELGAFTRFLALAASRTGTLVNLAEFGREVGVTAPTAKRWLSVLEASQVIFLLPAFHRDFGKRIRKSPKLYFMDPGLASYLMGLHDAEAVLHGPAFGPLVETAVVSEWVKAFRSRGERPEMAFWRSSAGHEVDIVMERGGELFGIEVKATATPTPGHVASLAEWLTLSGARGGSGLPGALPRYRSQRNPGRALASGVVSGQVPAELRTSAGPAVRRHIGNALLSGT